MTTSRLPHPPIKLELHGIFPLCARTEQFNISRFLEKFHFLPAVVGIEPSTKATSVQPPPPARWSYLKSRLKRRILSIVHHDEITKLPIVRSDWDKTDFSIEAEWPDTNSNQTRTRTKKDKRMNVSFFSRDIWSQRLSSVDTIEESFTWSRPCSNRTTFE